MKKLIDLWNEYIEELIDIHIKNNKQPTGTYEQMKKMYRGAVSFNQFMEWLEEKAI